MDPCHGIRTIVVPPDIVAVPRRSPPRARKRTPWHPRPDGEAMTVRPGEREWFSDRLFVESQSDHARSGFSASFIAHACFIVALVAFLMARPLQHVVARSAELPMPAFISQRASLPIVQPLTSVSVDRTKSSVAPVRAAAVAAPAPATADFAAVPVEAPSGISAERTAEQGVAGVDGGLAWGIAGGVVGGTGTEPSPSGASGLTVVRAGNDIKLPRKIKDFKPLYPVNALPGRVQGAVLIEATIGSDGRVHETRLLHSVVALLDEAALDAVRRWEYEPTTLNGVPVAVVITVVVNFALQ
jgi:protein TonB